MAERNLKTFVGVVFLLLAGCSSPHPQQPQAKERSAPVAPSIRVSYPFSVIDGGVASASDFQQVRFSSPLLAEHYSDVGLRVEKASMPQDRWMYASWRRDQTIYWTTHRILVRKGETVFTDGTSLIRGRCGNRLSEEPRTPVAVVQPPEVSSETPTVSLPDAPQLPPVSLSGIFYPVPLPEEFSPKAAMERSEQGEFPSPYKLPETVPVHPGPIVFAGTRLVSPARVQTAVTTVDTPEPSTWTLLLVGLVLIPALHYACTCCRADSVSAETPSHSSAGKGRLFDRTLR